MSGTGISPEDNTQVGTRQRPDVGQLGALYREDSLRLLGLDGEHAQERIATLERRLAEYSRLRANLNAPDVNPIDAVAELSSWVNNSLLEDYRSELARLKRIFAQSED